jgi:3-oxoacyl-[acyl-carrier-protein] synthase-1
MSQLAVAIAGVGVCTSLGLDAESSLAACEAGLSRMVETDEFSNGEHAAVCAPLELLPLGTARGRRIHWLAGAAYLDLLRRFPAWQRVSLPVVMVGPEPAADHDVPRDFMITHLRELGDAAVPRSVDDGWHAGGRGGWFLALERAVGLLMGGEPLVALLSVDTDCDPASLLRLSRRRALLGRDNPNGRIPGEAAAVILLARSDVLRATSLHARAWLRDVRRGHEPLHALQGRSTQGEGLTAVFGALRAAHPTWRADAVYSAQPNSKDSGREFKLAALRNASLLPEPMRLHGLHDTLGDCGAAAPAVQLAFAALRWARGDGERRVLIYGESDDGTLGACLLEAGEAPT